MFRGIRIGVLTAALVVAAPAAFAPAPAIAQQSQGTLHVRKWKHVVDGGGQTFLSIQFLNTGTKPITLLGIAPTRVGPWINLGQKLQPGEMTRALMKATKGDPEKVWVDCSEGLLVFEPPSQR